jgi:hypothetical protein
MMEWLLPVALGCPLPVPPLLFFKGKETGCHSQIPFPVRRPDMESLLPRLLVRATLISGER